MFCFKIVLRIIYWIPPLEGSSRGKRRSRSSGVHDSNCPKVFSIVSWNPGRERRKHFHPPLEAKQTSSKCPSILSFLPSLSGNSQKLRDQYLSFLSIQTIVILPSWFGDKKTWFSLFCSWHYQLPCWLLVQTCLTKNPTRRAHVASSKLVRVCGLVIWSELVTSFRSPNRYIGHGKVVDWIS